MTIVGDSAWRWSSRWRWPRLRDGPASSYLLVFRPLRHAPSLAKVVASIGLVIVFMSLVDRRFADRPSSASVRSCRASRSRSATRSPCRATGSGSPCIVLVIAAVVWAGSRFTRIGLVTRAAAENEKAPSSSGSRPTASRGSSFVVATMLGGFDRHPGGRR